MLLPALSVVLLHRLGRREFLRVDWSDPAGWFGTTPLEDLTATAIRLLALVVAYWLTASTLLYLIGRAAGWVRLTRTVGVMTIPSIRRLIDTTVAGSIAALTVAGPAVAVTEPPVLPPVVAVPEAYQVAAGVDPLSIEIPTVIDDETEIVIVADATLEIVIRRGDNLWDLASRRMTDVLGRNADDHEVAQYWIEVIHANEDRIASGDPDVVRPGDVILLPPVRV